MSLKFKFALSMRDDVEVHDLIALRKHFDSDKALEYFRNGKLIKWLSDRYYDDEAAAIKAIDLNDPNATTKICAALNVQFDELLKEDFEARVKEKQSILSKMTNDATIIANARVTALNQEDLADLIDLDEPLIYLCGSEFTVPIRIEDKRYIGVLGAPKIDISAKSQADLDAKKIAFKNVVLPWGADIPSASEDEEAAPLEFKHFHVPAYNVRRGAYERTTTIENQTGIHARPASIFVKTAGSFNAKIQIRANGKTIDAKSIFSIMSLGLVKGTEITIIADGPDEREAVDSLIALIDSKFGEG